MRDASKGEYVPPREARKAERKAHGVPDPRRPGENYVFQRTGRLRNKQSDRHWLAREVGRMQREGEISGHGAADMVAKILRKSKGTNQKAQNYGEAFRIVGRYGLPRDEARGMAFVKTLHDNWPKIKEGDVPPGAHLDRHSTKFILDHPEVFRDKHFWQALEVAHSLQERIGRSPVNQHRPQVAGVINPRLELEGIPRILEPEEMVTPGAVKLLPKRGAREQPWSRTEALDYMKAQKKQLGELRRTGRSAEAKPLARRLKALDKEMAGLMRPPEHGGAVGGISTTKAVARTPEMERAFLRAAKREAKRMGLREPIPYLADVMPSKMKGGQSFPNYGALHPLRKQWPSQGKAATSGNALSDFESVMRNSFIAPRVREAQVKGLQWIFDRGSRKIAGRRYLTYKQWEQAAAKGEIPPDVIPIRTQMLRALQEGDHPVDPVEFRKALVGEMERGQKIVSGEGAGAELAGEMAAAKELGVKGEKFAPMNATLMRELIRHFEGPSSLSRAVGKVTNAVSGAILNSVGFEASQFAQEGGPGAAALGRDVVHIPWAIKNLKEIDKLPIEDQAAIKATIGAGSGLSGIPVDPLSPGFMDPIRAAGGPKMWQRAWDLLRGKTLRNFDVERAGRFREVGSLAKTKGELTRAERAMRLGKNAKGLFKNLEKAVEDMRGMGVGERHLYIAEHPVLADRMTRQMRGMMGDWNSFTALEKEIAPFAIFYPFQRYAALWGLFHFPLDHPFVTTSLAMLGAVNAQELKKYAAEHGKAVPSVLDYTKPVIPTGNGEHTILPGGQRFSPILGSLQQAALEGKPSEALNTASPAFSIPIEALTGKNAYTGEPLGENGWLYALRQVGNLSPMLRFLGLPEVGQSDSTARQAFHSLDPLRNERSVWNPYIGQSPENFGKEKQLSTGFEKKYGKGRDLSSHLPPEVWDAAYNHDWKAARRLRRLRMEAEQGEGVVKRFEKPFQGGGNKDLGKEGSEILKYITGQVGPFPAEEDEGTGNPYLDALGTSKKKKGNPYLEALGGSSSSGGGNPYLEALK